MVRGIVRQPVPPLPDGEGAGPVIGHRRPHPDRRRHGPEHGVACLPQPGDGLGRRSLAHQPPSVQHQQLVRHGQHLVQLMLRENDRGSKLPVDPLHRRQEIRGGNGVQLAGGLVQKQHPGLQDHGGGQVQKLLLPA